MATNIELLQEAERRGILPEDKKPLLDEARRRGIVLSQQTFEMPVGDGDETVPVTQGVTTEQEPPTAFQAAQEAYRNFVGERTGLDPETYEKVHSALGVLTPLVGGPAALAEMLGGGIDAAMAGGARGVSNLTGTNQGTQRPERDAVLMGQLAGLLAAGTQSPRALMGRAAPRPERLPTEGQATMQAANRQGLDVLPADVGGPLTRRATSVTAQTPFGAGPVVTQAQKNVAQFGDRVADLASSQGVVRSSTDLGDTLQAGARKYITRSSRQGADLYKRAENLSGGTRVTPTSAVNSVRSQIAELKRAPNVNRDKIAVLEDVLSDITDASGNPNPVGVKVLRDLRTSARESISNRGIRGSDIQRRLDRVINSINDDVARDLSGVRTSEVFSPAIKSNRQIGGNYSTDLSSYSERLFRETSPSRAIELMPNGTIHTDVGRIYLSDTPNLALGQKGNKGVLLSFDAKGISGHVNKKPGTDFTFSRGSAEFYSDITSQNEYRKRLVGIRIPDDLDRSVPDAPLFQRTVDRLVKSGWAKIRGEGYTDIVRPDRVSSGADAAAAYRRADRFWQTRVTSVDEAISRILGKKGDLSAEAAANRLTQISSNRGDSRALQRIIETLPSEQRRDVVASVIGNLGKAKPEADFSLNTFLTQYQNMSGRAKNVLFKGETRQALDDLATVAKAVKESQKYANTSNTGSIPAMILTYLSPAAGLDMGASVIGGQYAAGHLLASPKFARWLGRAAKASKASVDGKPVNFDPIMRELIVLSRSPDIGGDVVEFMNATGIQRAAAEEENGDVPQ